jgi:hypothetical protein
MQRSRREPRLRLGECDAVPDDVAGFQALPDRPTLLVEYHQLGVRDEVRPDWVQLVHKLGKARAQVAPAAGLQTHEIAAFRDEAAEAVVPKLE